MKISTEIVSAYRIVGEEKAVETIAKAGLMSPVFFCNKNRMTFITEMWLSNRINVEVPFYKSDINFYLHR